MASAHAPRASSAEGDGPKPQATTVRVPKLRACARDVVQDGQEPGLPTPVGQEGEVGVQELKGFGFPPLEQGGPEVGPFSRHQDDSQQGVRLGPPGGALQGEVEVLQEAVDPLVVDGNPLPLELLGNPAVAVLGVPQQDLFYGPLEAALFLLPLPVRSKLGFA